MRGIVLIPFFLLVLLGVGNGVPQIYTHLIRDPPVDGAPIGIPNAPAAPAAAAPTFKSALIWEFDIQWRSAAEEFSLVLENRSWNSAKSYCTKMGGDLAFPRSLESLKAVLKANGYTSPYWVGATDIEKEGTWRWLYEGGLKGPFVVPRQWNSGEPDSRGGVDEDCAHFWTGGSPGTLDDRDCDTKLPFICQWTYVWYDG